MSGAEHSVEIAQITDADREALVDALRRAPNAVWLRLPGPVDITPTFGPYLASAAEMIVRNHVARALENAAWEIERGAGLVPPPSGPHPARQWLKDRAVEVRRG